MATTLLASMQELSKQLSDSFQSTTTGAGSTTTLVDTALMAKQNDWITLETWAFLTEEPTGDAAIYDERLISSLVNSNGTLTTLAFGGTPGSGIDYEVHRLLSPSDKRRGLIAACRSGYPSICKEVRDESLVSGNWLKDGSFERWASSLTALTDWTTTTSTIAQTSTAYYFKHGAYSCKISTAAGSVKQSVTNYDDLKRLAGKTVTFTVQGWCDTASCLRIAIYDGTTTTYSDYHDGSDTWTENNDPLSVTATIKDNPTAIEFQILHDVAAGVSYVDDARAISGENGKVYIGHLGLAQNIPYQVFVEPADYYTGEPWIPISGIKFDTTNGYMYLPDEVIADYRLRVIGIGYLDFLASGVSSTAWTATVAIDQPQLDILIAEAICYLYRTMAMPNFTTGDRTAYGQAYGFWQDELRKRKLKFGIVSPPATVSWR